MASDSLIFGLRRFMRWDKFGERVGLAYFLTTWLLILAVYLIVPLGSLIVEGYGRILGFGNPHTFVHCVRLGPFGQPHRTCDIIASGWHWPWRGQQYLYRFGLIVTPAFAILDALAVMTYRKTCRLIGKKDWVW